VHVSGAKSRPFTVGAVLWPVKRVCAVTNALHSLCVNWINSHNWVYEDVNVGRWKDQPFAFCRPFGIASIFWTESSTCTWSVYCCTQPSQNENQQYKDQVIMSLQKPKVVYGQNVWRKIGEASPAGYTLKKTVEVIKRPGRATTSLTLLGPILVWSQQNYLRLLLTMRYLPLCPRPPEAKWVWKLM